MSRCFLALFLLLCVALAGCGGGGKGRVTDATLRVFNAVCDSTSLDIIAADNDGEYPFGTNLPYLGSSPNFARIEGKEYDFILRESGTSNELWAILAQLVANRHYMLVAVGLQNYALGEEEKRAQLTGIDIDRAKPNGNKARIVVVHNYNRMVGFETTPIDFQTPGDNPIFKIENILPQNFSTVEIDADGVTPLTVEARRAGSELILVSETTTLGAGKIYLVLVSGLEGGAGVQAPRIEFIEVQPK